MTDIFIKLDGIPGDSRDIAHPNEIAVESWRWKLARHRANESDLLYGNGRKGVGGIEFVHNIDRATPNLMHYCLTGKRIAKAVLSLRKANSQSQDFFVVTMSNVLIDKLEPASAGIDHYEHVSLSFTTVRQEYISQNERGNNAIVSASYDMYRQA